MQNNLLCKALLILDTDIEPKYDDEFTIFNWNGYDEKNNSYSIPAFLERHSDRLRNKYLSFISGISESEIDNKTIVEHLTIKDGHNLWWMSLIAEKSPFKSPHIFDCLRLLALEEIILDGGFNQLKLNSDNKILAEAVQLLCQNLGISFSWNKVKSSKNFTGERNKYYYKIPFQVRYLASLMRNLIRLWPLTNLRKPNWFSGKNTITIISYFDNFDVDMLKEGSFKSGYWGSIGEVFNNANTKVNWLHLYSKVAVPSDLAFDMRAINSINKHANVNECHAFLESYLNRKCILRAVNNYIKLVTKRWHWNSGKVSLLFTSKDFKASLWPFLKQDWNTSIRGTGLFHNLLWIELFDMVMADMPQQNTGLYLHENQDWERAMIHSWRQNGNSKIIGVVHTPIRYWDMRYFNNLCKTKTTKVFNHFFDEFQPDTIALNGPYSFNQCVDDCYPKNRMVKVEALRYEAFVGMSDFSKEKSRIYDTQTKCNVLILGQILHSQSHNTLKCLETATQALGDKYTFTIKSHPTCYMSPDNYPNLPLKEVKESLDKILPLYDVAIIAGSSTAALDAYLSGLKVIVFLDTNDFNYSPMRGSEDVSFVSNANDMIEALLSSSNSTTKRKLKECYFWLDKDLSKWKHLLAQ